MIAFYFFLLPLRLSCVWTGFLKCCSRAVMLEQHFEQSGNLQQSLQSTNCDASNAIVRDRLDWKTFAVPSKRTFLGYHCLMLTKCLPALISSSLLWFVYTYFFIRTYVQGHSIIWMLILEFKTFAMHISSCNTNNIY